MQSNFVRSKTIVDYHIPLIQFNFKMNDIFYVSVSKHNTAINILQQFMKEFRTHSHRTLRLILIFTTQFLHQQVWSSQSILSGNSVQDVPSLSYRLPDGKTPLNIRLPLLVIYVNLWLWDHHMKGKWVTHSKKRRLSVRIVSESETWGTDHTKCGIGTVMHWAENLSW